MRENQSRSQTPTLDLYLSNLAAYNEGQLRGEWISFPMDAEEFQEVQKRIGIGEKHPDGSTDEEMFVTDYNSAIPGMAHLAGENPDLNVLNQIAADYDALDPWDQEKINAVMEAGEPENLNELDNLMNDPNQLDELQIYEGGADNRIYGETLIEETLGGPENLPEETLQRYFDYEAFGEAVKADWGGEEIGNDYVMTDDVNLDDSEPEIDPETELPAQLSAKQLQELQNNYQPDGSQLFLGDRSTVHPTLEVAITNRSELEEKDESDVVRLDLPVSQ